MFTAPFELATLASAGGSPYGVEVGLMTGVAVVVGVSEASVSSSSQSSLSLSLSGVSSSTPEEEGAQVGSGLEPL